MVRKPACWKGAADREGLRSETRTSKSSVLDARIRSGNRRWGNQVSRAVKMGRGGVLRGGLGGGVGGGWDGRGWRGGREGG